MIEEYAILILTITLIILLFLFIRQQRRTEYRARMLFESWRERECEMIRSDLRRQAEDLIQREVDLRTREWTSSEEVKIRKDAVRRSREVIHGKVTEHLITPNIVKVDKAESYVFDKFHEITAPRLKYWFNADAAKHLWTFSRGGPDNEILPEVDVLGKKKIGVYDVIVLRSRKAEDLIKWLNDNKYQVPQNIEPILDDYIKRGWVFTISKVNAAGFKDKNKQITGNLEPLAFDFNTNEPVFPLKLSSLNKGKTRILIYTVTTSKMDCKELKTLYASDGNHERKMRYYFHRIYYATKGLICRRGMSPFKTKTCCSMLARQRQ